MDPHLPKQKPASEAERIREVYAERTRSVPSDRYSWFYPAHLFMIQRRESALLAMLKAQGCESLSGLRILDVGCGNGSDLRKFNLYGARPANLFGVDLVESRIREGRALCPDFDLRCSDASRLPYEDGFFDIVSQSTVFSSILDRGMRIRVAREMVRVLKPGGFVIWYDLRRNNPGNPDVRGIPKREVRELFPDCVAALRSITLAPPLTRMLIGSSRVACEILEDLRVLNTHCIALLRKENLIRVPSPLRYRRGQEASCRIFASV